MNTNIRQTYTKTKRMTSAWEKRFEERYWYRKRNQHTHMNINICIHDHTSETHEWETGWERRRVSTYVAASSQLFYSLATLVIMKESPPASRWRHELVELFSEHIEGKVQKRRDTTRKGRSTKINWCGASHTQREHDDWLSRKRPPDRYD